MTFPSLYRGRDKLLGFALKPRRWTATVMAVTLLGGTLAAAITLLARKTDLALGFFSGGVLSSLNFYGLKILTEKTLSLGNRKGRTYFWFWNIFRWVLFAFACWALVLVSGLCLLGAVASYLWFLTVLGWVGWRSASFPKAS